MKLLSSLTNRIFLASAALPVHNTASAALARKIRLVSDESSFICSAR